MTEYDQEQGPTLDDLMNSKKVKITVLVLLCIAVIAAQLDIWGAWG